MKRNMLCAAMVLVAGSLLAADKDDVSAAIAKLAAADNYSWKSTTTNIPPPVDTNAPADDNGGGGGRRRGGFGNRVVDGKAQKGGLMYMTWPGFRGGNQEGFVQSTNGAVKTDDGWQSFAEATADDGGGGFNPARFTAMQLQNTQSPTDQAKSLLDSAKGITKVDDAYVGDLNDDSAKGLLQFPGFGRGGGGGGGFEITITDAKATVKFWIKDGVLTKFETHVTGKTQFGDNDPMDANRINTVEVKDVGATKIEVPDDAKKKISG